MNAIVHRERGLFPEILDPLEVPLAERKPAGTRILVQKPEKS
ncbi:hypothetical protein [Nonomuraea sp. NPDC049625]